MQAEDRQYPVILDPVVEAGKNRDNIVDTTVYEDSPNSAFYSDGVLKLGKDKTRGIMRSYVKFCIDDIYNDFYLTDFVEFAVDANGDTYFYIYE